MRTDLQELQDYIQQRWPFDDAHYQAFRSLTTEDRTERAARHILFHLQKEVAKLATFFERKDHQPLFNDAPESMALRDLLICTLRYAALRGYHAVDLTNLIHLLYDA